MSGFIYDGLFNMTALVIDTILLIGKTVVQTRISNKCENQASHPPEPTIPPHATAFLYQ